MAAEDRPRRRARMAVGYGLLLGECVVILIPSVYGRLAPKLFGIPFFYWFQLLWILVAMAVTGVAYLLVAGRDTAADSGVAAAGVAADAESSIRRQTR